MALTLANGQTRLCVNISISSDSIVESAETFSVTVTSDDSSVEITNPSAEVLIMDSTSKKEGEGEGGRERGGGGGGRGPSSLHFSMKSPTTELITYYAYSPCPMQLWMFPLNSRSLL